MVFHVPLAEELAMELHCEIMDHVLAQENIALIKKRKKAYEMNMHFEDTSAVKLPWAESIIGSNDKVVQVQCKVCFSLIVKTSF